MICDQRDAYFVRIFQYSRGPLDDLFVNQLAIVIRSQRVIVDYHSLKATNDLSLITRNDDQVASQVAEGVLNASQSR